MPEIIISIAAIVVSVGKIRIEFDSFVVILNRSLVLPEITISIATIVVSLDKIRIEFNSLSVKFYRSGIVAAFSKFKSLGELLSRQRNFFFVSQCRRNGKVLRLRAEKFVVFAVANINDNQIFLCARDARVNHFVVEKFFSYKTVADNQNFRVNAPALITLNRRELNFSAFHLETVFCCLSDVIDFLFGGVTVLQPIFFFLESGYRLVTFVAQNFVDGANISYYLRQNANVIVGRRVLFEGTLKNFKDCIYVKQIEEIILYGCRVAGVFAEQIIGRGWSINLAVIAAFKKIFLKRVRQVKNF